ncbi:MAG: MCE family protein [Actinomycetota bacterium]
MSADRLRVVVGATASLAVIAVIAVSVGLFNGAFTRTFPLTVISTRAGLVMNPDAKVKFHGVPIGHVTSIEPLPDGRAALHLGIDPDQVHLLPQNIEANIASSTVFGAKFVQLTAPARPASTTVHAGQTLRGDHVTVELNTVFEQLTRVLHAIEPVKLNETLGALSKALNGRGKRVGASLTDLERVLGELEPGLANLSHVFEDLPTVLNSYADAAPNLVEVADATSTISRTVVDSQNDLDEFLVSTTGLATVGQEVLAANEQPLADTLRLLVPTTDLLNQYHHTINCAVEGILPVATTPPLAEPGVVVSSGLTLGIERYRYPSNLPKVAATGDPTCLGLPRIPMNSSSKFLVADVGANPSQYGNQGIVLNSDLLKQLMFGPIDGPPRNTAQVGQPG